MGGYRWRKLPYPLRLLRSHHGALGGAGPRMVWISPDEVPASTHGKVQAVQLARMATGFGTARGAARICLRTPRPHLEKGGGLEKDICSS